MSDSAFTLLQNIVSNRREKQERQESLKKFLKSKQMLAKEHFSRPSPTLKQQILEDASFYHELHPNIRSLDLLAPIMPHLASIRQNPVASHVKAIPSLDLGYIKKPASREDLPDYLITKVQEEKSIFVRGYVRLYRIPIEAYNELVEKITQMELPQLVPWIEFVPQKITESPPPIPPVINGRTFFFDSQWNRINSLKKEFCVCLNYAGVTTQENDDESALLNRIKQDSSGSNSFLNIILDNIPSSMMQISVSLVYKCLMKMPINDNPVMFLRSNPEIDELERVLILGIGPGSLNSATGGTSFYSDVDERIGKRLLEGIESSMSVFTPKLQTSRERFQAFHKVHQETEEPLLSLYTTQKSWDWSPALQDATRSPWFEEGVPGLLLLCDPTEESTKLNVGFFGKDLSNSGALYLYRWVYKWLPNTKDQENWLNAILGCSIDVFPTPDKTIDRPKAELLKDFLLQRLEIIDPIVIGICGSKQANVYKIFGDENVDPKDLFSQSGETLESLLFKPKVGTYHGKSFILLPIHHPAGAKYHPDGAYSYNNLVAISFAMYIVLIELVIKFRGRGMTREMLVQNVLEEFSRTSSSLLDLGKEFSDDYYMFQRVKFTGKRSRDRAGVAAAAVYAKREKLAERPHRKDQVERLAIAYQDWIKSEDPNKPRSFIHPSAPPADTPEFEQVMMSFKDSSSGKSLFALFWQWGATQKRDPDSLKCNFVARNEIFKCCLPEYESIRAIKKFRKYFCLQCGQIDYGIATMPKFRGKCIDGHDHIVSYYVVQNQAYLMEECSNAYTLSMENNQAIDVVPVKVSELLPVVEPLNSGLCGLPDSELRKLMENTVVYLGPIETVQNFRRGLPVDFLWLEWARETARIYITLMIPSAETEKTDRFNDFLDYSVQKLLLKRLPTQTSKDIIDQVKATPLEKLKETLQDIWTICRVETLMEQSNHLHRALRQGNPICVWVCKDCIWFALGNGRRNGGLLGNMQLTQKNTMHGQHSVHQLFDFQMEKWSELTMETRAAYLVHLRTLRAAITNALRHNDQDPSLVIPDHSSSNMTEEQLLQLLLADPLVLESEPDVEFVQDMLNRTYGRPT